jgi:zeta-carotene desaturase
MQAIPRESKRNDLDNVSMLDWLKEKRQPAGAIERYWRQVLVSAINEELDGMAAAHGLQVFRLGFLARKDAYEMGVPAVPLGRLYGSEAWKRIGTVELQLRAARVAYRNRGRSRARSHRRRAGSTRRFLCLRAALRTRHRSGAGVGYRCQRVRAFAITGIHLWFDRPVTKLPHATLLDRTIQWMFNKHQGRYVQLVVSASRSLTEMPRADVIALALKELAEFFPAAREAKLEKAHVVKEIRATFSARPGLEAHRPVNHTTVPNLFLAGDWTKSGWPATMEGAVRSGYLAAQAVTAAAGAPKVFILPDIA